jgi:hypothetical protein
LPVPAQPPVVGRDDDGAGCGVQCGEQLSSALLWGTPRPQLPAPARTTPLWLSCRIRGWPQPRRNSPSSCDGVASRPPFGGWLWCRGGVGVTGEVLEVRGRGRPSVNVGLADLNVGLAGSECGTRRLGLRVPRSPPASPTFKSASPTLGYRQRLAPRTDTTRPTLGSAKEYPLVPVLTAGERNRPTSIDTRDHRGPTPPHRGHKSTKVPVLGAVAVVGRPRNSTASCEAGNARSAEACWLNYLPGSASSERYFLDRLLALVVPATRAADGDK